ncbi:MAG: TonB-dependent receptor [Reichenbachiella sp.]|uniref:SusC/RagA family TonB-linked outer membrane protein n=1 Tax=Reichenbachiella sp. TaxID=2184521 RepID=UPI00326368D6
MKKCTHGLFPKSKKLLIVTKLTLFLMCWCVVQVSGNVYSQGQELQIHMEDVTLEQVFSEIRNQTEYEFLYDSELLVDQPKVDAEFNQITVGEFLNRILPESLEHIIVDKTIVIKKSTRPKFDTNNLPEDIELKGKITDENGEGLPGVSVLIKGTTKGTVTDLDGYYSISAPADAVLQVSYIGYSSQEILVGNQTAIDISLVPDITQLEDIVVVGYGTQKRSDITGSISTVEAVKNITDRPLNNAEQAIQGSVAGVTVVNDGGDPTATPKVTIRGIGTTSNSNPLWVIDGVPQQDPAIISTMNPADIASMTVLKDASASAIYGVRAANGVILVTTKRGKSGELSVNYNTYYGFTNAWKKPTALTATEYAEMENQAQINDGNTPLAAFSATDNPDGRIQRTNWVDEIFQTGIVQNHDLSVRGGGENATFATSFGYYKRTGTLLNTEKRRVNFRINSDFKLSDKLTVGESIWMSHTNGRGLDPTNEGDVYENNILLAIYANPNASVREADGSFSGPAPLSSNYASAFEARNPVQDLTNSDISNPILNLTGNFFLAYEFNENLKFKSTFGVNLVQNTYKEFRPSTPNSPANSLFQSQASQVDWISENTLTFTKTFNEDHDITLLAGYTLQDFSFESFGVTGSDFGSEDDNVRFLGNARALDLARSGSDIGEKSLVSWLGRVNYAYKGKYSLTASLRRDATSRLTKDNRVGVFPSVGVAWNIIEEGFMQNVSFVSDLRFRGGWGEIGNIEALSFYPTDVPLANVSTISFNGDESVSAQAIDGISNPDLVWEKTQQLNLGFDSYFLDNKISLSADYFVKTTKDVLLQLPLSALAGVTEAPFVNAGEIENKGVELALGYRKVEGEFTYNINANVSRIKNEVTALGQGVTEILHTGPDAVFRNSFFPLKSEVGQPLYSFYVIESDGIFQSDDEAANYTHADGTRVQPNAVAGDLKFIDANGDGTINDQDRVYKGNAFPDFSYGVNANFNYKNFDLSVFFQGVSGANVYSSYKNVSFNAGQNLFNRDSRILDAWSPTNTGSDIPRLTKQNGSTNFDTVSDWYLQDASYLRLKNITLGYRLPAEILEKVNISNLRLYVTGQNLLTLTGYDGLDPEVGGLGVDNGRYPASRSVVFGLNVGF